MYCNKVIIMVMMMIMIVMMMTMIMMMMMMMTIIIIIIIIIIINWLQVRRIRLQVTNNLVRALSYSQASSFYIDLVLILPLGHERYAVIKSISCLLMPQWNKLRWSRRPVYRMASWSYVQNITKLREGIKTHKV